MICILVGICIVFIFIIIKVIKKAFGSLRPVRQSARMKAFCLKLEEGVVKLDLFRQCYIEIELALPLDFMERHFE
jgi:hypothetical protein